MDPASCPAPDGRPPPAHAGLPVGLPLVLAQIAPAGLAVRLGALVALLALAGALAGAEAALFAAPAPPEGAAADASGHRARWLRERPRPVLVALLLLNTLLLASATLLALPMVAAAAGALGLSGPAGLTVGCLALAFVWLVAGVAVPRLRALRRPETAGARATAVAYPLVRAVFPLAALLARGMERVQGRSRPPAEPLSAEDVRTMAEAGESSEPLGEEEAALIRSILEFGDTEVREVMVSRLDIVALPTTATLDAALALIREAGHSRYPLYGAGLDDILGVVYAKDLLPLAGPTRAAGQSVDWPRLARKARFVPPTRKLDDLLQDFQAHRTHIAIVVDEYGGTLGIATLEDLLEEVVGEIRDELDTPEDEPRLVPVGPDAFRADARLDLDDFFEAMGVDVDADAFAFETVGGLVFHLAGAVPDEGQEVTFGGLRFRVETLEANRIREVLVTRLPQPAPSDAGSEA